MESSEEGRTADEIYCWYYHERNLLTQDGDNQSILIHSQFLSLHEHSATSLLFLDEKVSSVHLV